MYVSFLVKPLLSKAFLHVSFALLNTCSSQEMSDIRLLIDFGSFLKCWEDDLIVYEYKLVYCLVYGNVDSIINEVETGIKKIDCF